MHFKLIAAIASIALTSACGGSSVSNQERFQSLIDRADDLDDNLIDGQEVLAASALPTSDSAQYNGVLIALGGTGNPGLDTETVIVAYAGELEMNINFESGTLSGTADKFAQIENPEDSVVEDTDPVVGDDVTGSLTFSGEQSDSVEATYEFSYAGQLEGSDGSYLNYDEVGGAADVYGENAEALSVRGGALVPFDGEDGFIAIYGVAGQ